MTNVRVLVFYALAGVSACHGNSGTSAATAPAPQVQAPATVKKGPSVAEQTVGMVEAATLGKSTVPVQLKFDLRQKPQVGKPVEIHFAVMPLIDASPASIQVTGSDGLDLTAAGNQIEIPSVQAGEVYLQSVKVTPGTDGVLLLGLTISLKHDEITESRVFTVPLIVDR